MSLRIFLVCVPPTTSHHAKRIVRIGKFSRLADKPELVATKELLDTLLLPHQPTSPLVPPYRLSLAFTWPWLGKHGKRIRALGRIPHMSKPDCDNCSKSITDRLVRLRFIEDDKAVVELHVRKWWGGAPGIQIEIDTLRERREADSEEFACIVERHGCYKRDLEQFAAALMRSPQRKLFEAEIRKNDPALKAPAKKKDGDSATAH